MSKTKGINAERELIHLFWENKWSACRVAGSGSMRYPSPDIIAGNNVRKIALECKVTKNIKQYLTSKETAELREFADQFGAEPWIGIKFNNVAWYFLSPDDLEKAGKQFGVSIPLAKRRGLSFKELIGL